MSTKQYIKWNSLSEKTTIKIVGKLPYFRIVNHGILHGLIVGGFYYETKE